MRVCRRRRRILPGERPVADRGEQHGTRRCVTPMRASSGV
jgi:hypothetical protein